MLPTWNKIWNQNNWAASRCLAPVCLTTRRDYCVAEYESSWNTQYAGYAERGAYPFGTQFCDTNATATQKTSGLNANIQFTIPFYGATYHSLLVSYAIAPRVCVGLTAYCST